MTHGPDTIAPERATAPASRDAKPQAADVLVVFGITGDLARVMTFHSLYRLEARGLLDCPIVGVAVDDWTDDQLRTRARQSIEGTGQKIDDAVFDRFAERLSYVSGDFADAATYERVGEAIGGASTPVFYLEIPPFLFGAVVKGLAEAGLTKTGRVVVEKPFGHDRESARALAAELHNYIDESQLYRIDHYLGKMGVEEILHLRFRERHARADLEPQLHRVRPDHDGGGLRRRRPRPLLRPRRRAARRRRQPPDAGRGRSCDGAPIAAASPTTIKNAQVALFHSVVRGEPGALCARPVRRLSRHRRCRRGLDDGDLRRTAARHRELALVRRAVLHSDRQASRRNADRAPARLQAAPEDGFPHRRRPARAEPACHQARPEHGDQARRAGSPRPITPEGARSISTWSSRRRAAKAPLPTRCCSRQRWSATAPASHARTESKRPGGSCSRCSTRPRRCIRTHRGRGARRRRTSSSPATAGGTDHGWSNDNGRSQTRAARSERGGAVPVPADRGLRVPVGLSHRGARRRRRSNRLAVRPELRLAERVRQPARPRGRLLPLRALRDQPPDRAHLRPGHERPGDDLEDAKRLDRGARRADHGPAEPRGHHHAAHPAPGGRRRRPHARSHGGVPRRQRRGRARLRARLRLRPHAGGMVAGRRRSPHRRCARRRTDHPPAVRPRARRRGRPHPRASRARGRRPGLLRALVGRRAGGATGRRGRKRPPQRDHALLARLAAAGPDARSPLAGPDPALCAHDQGPHLHADRRDGGGADDVAARDTRGRAELGLPLHLDPRQHLHAPGAALAEPRLGGRRVHAVRRRRRADGGRVAADHVRDRRQARPDRDHT